MALKVIWSEEAENNLNEISECILESWNEKILQEFLGKLNYCIKQIQQFPELFPASLVAYKIRKCVITKQVSLFYIISKSGIEIAALFDNRQSAEKLKLRSRKK